MFESCEYKTVIVAVVVLLFIALFLFSVGGLIYWISTSDNKRFTVGMRNKSDDNNDEKPQEKTSTIAELNQLLLGDDSIE